MLSVASVKSASGAASYFAKDDYYTAEHASEATLWGGVGAAEIGLKGEVTKEAFEKILNGEMPSGKRSRRARTAGSGWTSPSRCRSQPASSLMSQAIPAFSWLI